MKAFFKDSDKIIINSMDYTEALVGKSFLEKLSSKDVKIEQRYDVNDDFDGLVISLIDKQPVEEPTDNTPIVDEPTANEPSTEEPVKETPSETTNEEQKEEETI